MARATAEAGSSKVRRRTIHLDRMPAPAQYARNGRNDDQIAIAVEIYTTVADPRTGRPHSPGNLARAVELAVAGTMTEADEDAGRAAAEHDRECLDHAAAARLAAEVGLAELAKVQDIPREPVESPTGVGRTRAQVAVEHLRDGEHAARREAAGDTRHRQRGVSRWVVLVAAAVLGVLDLVLLLAPILNLGPIDDARDLLYWLMAAGLAIALGVALHFSLSHHQDAERRSVDERNVLLDYNRSAQGPSRALPPPPDGELTAADDRLGKAQRILVAMAGITGVLTAVRIAVLAREAGLSVPETILFSSAVGIVLGLLVVLLGQRLCRGNALGDRLRRGREVVAETDRLRRAGLDAVDACRDEAVEELAAAREALARSRDERDSVYAIYLHGVQYAVIWLGVDHPIPDATVLLRRSMGVLREAEQQVIATEEALARLAAARAEDDRGPVVAEIETSPTVTDTSGAALVRFDETRGPHSEFIAGVKVPARPRDPWALLALVAVAIVAAASATAYFVPAGFALVGA